MKLAFLQSDEMRDQRKDENIARCFFCLQAAGIFWTDPRGARKKSVWTDTTAGLRSASLLPVSTQSKRQRCWRSDALKTSTSWLFSDDLVESLFIWRFHLEVRQHFMKRKPTKSFDTGRNPDLLNDTKETHQSPKTGRNIVFPGHSPRYQWNKD